MCIVDIIVMIYIVRKRRGLERGKEREKGKGWLDRWIFVVAVICYIYIYIYRYRYLKSK